MRLIDADALQKEHRKYNDGKRLMLVDVAPTIDAVEVVRCENCKHADLYADGDCMCLFTAYWVKPNDFCSYGERREEIEVEE